MKSIVLALVLAIPAVACSKSNKDVPASATTTTGGDTKAATGAAAGGSKGSCNKVNVTSKCDEYASLTMGFEEGMCKDLNGTWSTGACPTAGRLGTCKKKSGTTTYYYETKLALNYDAKSAKEDCEDAISEGTWTAAK